MRRVYLDHTATTPIDFRVFDSMKPYFMDRFGNASSIHSFGQESRAALEESRDILARILGASSGEVSFVGSGTESDNIALKGAAWAMQAVGKRNIITSKIEHHAVLESCEFLAAHGSTVTLLDVDQFGMVDPEAVRRAVTGETGIISVMHANNEVGTINPIGDISLVAREHGILFHTDAVQSFGKLAFDASVLSANLISISAHKIYGPKGIGGLYVSKGTRIERLIHGGGQERGRRAGTENVALAVGFARAAELLDADRPTEHERLLDLKDKLREMIAERFPMAIFNGHPTHSLPHLLSVSFDDDKIEIDGEALLFNLDLLGVAVSSGSACTSGSIQPSHVLLAMGRSPQTARATIRFSMGRSTTAEELAYAVSRLEDVVKRIGKPRR